MSISDSTFRQDVFDTVRAVLVAANLQTTIGSTVSRVSIAAVYNGSTFTKPQVVLIPIKKDEDNFKFGGTVGKRTANVIIECWASTTQGIDQLADQTATAISSVLTTSLMPLSLLEVHEDYAFSSPGETKAHLITQTFVFEKE